MTAGYRSKRDAWLSILLGGVIAVLVLALVPLSISMSSRGLVALPGMAVALVVLLMVGSTLTHTRYAIDGDVLRIRSGPFRWSILIKDIVSVAETNDPSSAPALSLDRLSIRYQSGDETREILVSPLERSAFVDALRAVNPGINVSVSPLS